MTIDGTAWRPSATLEVLRQRAVFVARIRAFFAARGVWEVETPLLSRAAVTDVHLESFQTAYVEPAVSEQRQLFLHTSPEYFMKRLLAAGSGAIYQICKVFRNGESGRRHNPEFTLLEWYRPGFDHFALMDEIDAMLQFVANIPAGRRATYAEVFLTEVNLDPHQATIEDIRQVLENNGLSLMGDNSENNKDLWLEFLFSHLIQPRLGHDRPLYLYDFPASQAALARVRPGPPAVAERFELFLNGLELANGFHELGDAVEQRMRFESDVAKRKQRGQITPPIDERFLAALSAGLPPSAGVAVGVDRFFMAAHQIFSISDVLSFDFSSV